MNISQRTSFLILAFIFCLSSCSIDPEKAKENLNRELSLIKQSLEKGDFEILFDYVPLEIVEQIIEISQIEISTEKFRTYVLHLIKESYKDISDLKYEIIEVGEVVEHDQKIFIRIRIKTSGDIYNDELKKKYYYESRGYMVAISSDRGNSFKMMNYDNEIHKTALNNVYNNVSHKLKLSFSRDNLNEIHDQILEDHIKQIELEEKTRITKLYEKYKKAIVKIEISNYYNVISSGTGFLMGDYVITNDHVINVNDARFISIYDYRGESLSFAEVVKQDPEFDYAIIEVYGHSSDMGFPYYSTSKHSVGEEVFTIGHPSGSLPNSLTKGLITGTSYYNYQIDNDVTFGASGSPVFTEEGVVLGIVTAVNYSNTATFALDIQRLALNNLSISNY